ncbi:acyltransferase domain-containing protein [Streptomyces sp. NPDC052077]|uniref:acyltransferase domain-containing protein n=1 Tax=Streptomyces sp. NPDC052077 TaxID=3154757 RepID=UPI00344319BB
MKPNEKTVFLFPGQGAFDGAALRLAHSRHPQVELVLKEVDTVAEELFGRGVSELLLEGEPLDAASILRHPAWVSQLAIYASDMAAFSVLDAHGVRAGVHVGHSLGEIAALVAAGAFSVADGARITAERARVIMEAGLGTGRMTALSMPADQVRKVIDLVGDELLAVASENHPTQTVISGPAGALARVVGIAGHIDVGAVELNSPFPFHNPVLAPLVPVFAQRIAGLAQRPLEVPVYSPILERQYTDSDVLTECLSRHFVLPVRFTGAMRRLNAEGFSVFVESGALGALGKLVRRNLPPAEATVRSSLALDAEGGLSLDALLNGLEGGSVPTIEEFWEAFGPRLVELVRAELNGGPAAAPATAAPATATEQPPAPAAAPAAADAAPGLPSTEEVAALVRTTYATALEYPEEVFTEDVLLEAELGVDSVKQVELLARVTRHYGLPPREAGFRLASYDTFGKVVDLVHTNLKGGTALTG